MEGGGVGAVFTERGLVRTCGEGPHGFLSLNKKRLSRDQDLVNPHLCFGLQFHIHFNKSSKNNFQQV